MPAGVGTEACALTVRSAVASVGVVVAAVVTPVVAGAGADDEGTATLATWELCG
ncbi:hypothetical protein [Mycolicibacterium sphagni]|uniref:hypothetical protein n=1 Tax=Mycolicibacterium sphagni TaxID=1786 RepID=UPI001F19565B|nr:hypothetical protein [Mycolicibacterium sphagni]